MRAAVQARPPRAPGESGLRRERQRERLVSQALRQRPEQPRPIPPPRTPVHAREHLRL